MACSTAAGVVACTVSNETAVTITTVVVQTIETVITKTEQTVTTVHASFGQTFTLSCPSPPWSSDSSSPGASLTAIVPSTMPPTKTWEETPPASTDVVSSMRSAFTVLFVTITELVIVLQGSGGATLTSSTVTLPATATLSSQPAGGFLTLAVGHTQGSGWSTWSDGARGGLIAGCVVAFLCLMFLTAWFCLKYSGKTLIAHDWAVNSHPGFISGHPIYGPGVPYPGMRGGGNHSGKGVREWLGMTTREEKKTRYNKNKAPAQAKCRERRPAFYLPPVQEDENEL